MTDLKTLLDDLHMAAWGAGHHEKDAPIERLIAHLSNPRYSPERVALLEAVSDAAKWLRSTAEYQQEAIERYEAAEAELAAHDRIHGL